MVDPKLMALFAKMAANSTSKTKEKEGGSDSNPDPKPLATAVASAVATASFSGIALNTQQQEACTLAADGKSFVLVGAAGTGKTTTTAAAALQLLKTHNASEIALCAFTRTAAKNIGRAMSKYPELTELAKTRCSTIHRLLGFRPVEFTIVTDDGPKQSMRFEPLYDAGNPLLNIKLVVIDEASMLGLDLWKQLHAACPNATFIFIGDLNQIPPVFGDSILGFKLLQLPVVELTEVYRQAMDSPIVGFQHKYTLAGIPPGDSLLPNSGVLKFLPLKTFIKDPHEMALATRTFFKGEFDAGNWNPQEDIILMPYNKAFGTIILNKLLAQFLGEIRGAEVHEVIAGFEKHYYAIGDRVRYNKEEYTITNITRNGSYRGVEPQVPSQLLTRLGTYKSGATTESLLSEKQDDWDFDQILEQVDSADDSAVNACSHRIELTATTTFAGEMAEVVTVSTRGELNQMDFGYAITIHKSQGSEWRKVYLIMTRHHAVMLSRELLYTGMTRAREELVVMYSGQSAVGKKDSSISRCCVNPRIPGRGWQEKKKYFQEKFAEYELHMDTDSSGLSREDRDLLEAGATLL